MLELYGLTSEIAIQTDLWREMDKEAVAQIFQAIPMKTASQGVATAIVAAFDPKLQGKSV